MQPFLQEEGPILNMTLRILGTPTEEIWPNVTSFPDFKSSFPKWSRNMATPLCSSLDDTGLDLLEAMLVYDPAGRISAKQACNHPYFEDYVPGGDYRPF